MKKQKVYLPEGFKPQLNKAQRFVTNLDTLDYELFEFVGDRNAYIQALKVKHEQEPALADLLPDCFALFYKWSPRINRKVPITRLMNREILSIIEASPGYAILRSWTKGDEYNSLTAVEMMGTLLQTLPWELRDLQDAIEEEIEKGDYKPDSRAQAMHKRKLKEVTDEMNESLDSHEGALEKMIRNRIQKAQRLIEAAEGAMKSLGWGSGRADLERGPVGERLKLADVLRRKPELIKLMDLAGRFINIAREKQSEKVYTERDEIESVEEGNDLPDVMPDEFIKLLDPTLEALFYKQFFEKRLQQYSLSAKRPRDRGPIYVAIDCSGSMVGDPDTWSKAVALAMYQIARDQHRDFHGCLFNGDIVDRIAVKSGSPIPIAKVESYFGARCGGGTDFEIPLEEFRAGGAFTGSGAARKFHPHRPDNADLIFITDGECDVTPEFLTPFLESKKQKVFHIYSVLIGSDLDSLAVLEKFSDKVIALEGNLEGNQGKAFEIVFNV